MSQQLSFYNSITGQVVSPADWQLQLKPGDYYVILQPDIGLLDVAGKVEQRDTGPTVYGKIETDEDTPGPGFFWVRGFSQWCPGGELGLMNICDPTRRLTEDQFNQARAAGWPDEPPTGEGGEGQCTAHV